MSESKKYYWLKLKSDFFDDDTIKFIEEQENGIKYSNFYLKLCLKSLKTDGKLIRLVGETLIPYDINSLSKLTGVDFDTVRSAMQLFENIGLIKILESGEIYLSQIDELIGSETDKAQLMRRLRAERKIRGNNVTQMLPEIEKEIEKEIEIEAEEEEKTATATQNCFKFYMENINPTITQYEVDLINEYLKEVSEELIINAMKEAIEHNARTMKYVKSILDRYINQRITTLEQLKMINNIKENTKEETEEEKLARRLKELEEE